MVEAGTVVVVVVAPVPVPVPVDDDPDPSPVVVVDVVVAPEPEPPVVVVVVVVVVAATGGATKATVSPRMVAALAEGVADNPVQPRAAFQLWSAVAAGAPLRGWGSPARIVAGRNTTPVMCRPSAVMMSEPLLVSGASSS